MIDVLRDLAALLGSTRLPAPELAERLGSHTVDLRGNILVQEPSLSGVTQASVVRAVQSDQPALITLKLERPLTLAELEAAFGASSVVSPEHRGELASAVFDVAQPDLPFSVALIAAIDDGNTSEVTLRRDQR